MVKITVDKSAEEKKEQPAGGKEVLQKQLVNAILSLPNEDIEKIAVKLAPYIMAHELRHPRIWGDPSRLIFRGNVHINDLLVNTRSGTVTIEEEVCFGHRCKLLTGTHDYQKKGRERVTTVPDSGRDIHVKQGVWLGSGVTVLGPCVIGEDAVIAAGSLVTVDEIPAGTIWAGSPAKQVRKIDFEDE